MALRCAQSEDFMTMTQFLPIDTKPAFAPQRASAAPERLIEGNPAFSTWELDTATAGAAGWTKIRSGIWEATEGTTKSIKGETFEYCHILEGRCEITEEGGATHVFGPGDNFLLKPGFVGQWKTLETLRKIFVIAS